MKAVVFNHPNTNHKFICDSNDSKVALLEENFSAGTLVAAEGEECRRLYLDARHEIQPLVAGARMQTVQPTSRI